jgi:hypothetical protein
MPIDLTEQQRKVLQETRAVDEPSEFQKLLDEATPEMNRIVSEVMEPAQPIPTILTELRELYLSVSVYEEALQGVQYDSTQKVFFRDAIRLIDTAHTWFGEGQRAGQYRVRSVDEVIQASRPWRGRIKAIGEHEFVFEPEIAEQFADTNTSGTLTEEMSDLKFLNKLVDQYKDRLVGKGLTDELILQGKQLQQEADGRDIAGILGLRDKDEALALRSRLVTYGILRGRQARAAGINACFDNAEARRRFEAASFRNALRRLRPRRKGAAATASDAPQPEQAPEKKPE